jgi:hypothetical protein
MPKTIITIPQSREIIEREGLKPLLWHYSYNLEHFYDHMVYEDGCIFAETRVNQWSPIPTFIKNPFWVCKLTTFEDYLKRRDKVSRYPDRNFPTTTTFWKKDKQLKGELLINRLDEETFITTYNELRRPDHMEGKELLNYIWKMNVGLPREWLKMMILKSDGIKAIGLIIDDDISNHLYNMASIIDKNGWGLYMITLWIKDCCERGIKFVDAGVSGTYGHYKDVIYLDTVR